MFGLWDLDISPVRLVGGTAALFWFVELMVPPDPLGHTALFIDALGETLAISLLGTLAAALLAFPVGLLAARNVVRNLVFHLAIRRVLDVIRSIDVLVWALVWIGVVGLGPFAGVLAIACSDFGAFGKLFSETVETTGQRAREGVAGRRRQSDRRDPLRTAAADPAGDRRAGALFLRVERPLGHDHRDRRRGGIGLHLYEADPHARVAGGVVPGADGAGHGRGDGLDLVRGCAGPCEGREPRPVWSSMPARVPSSRAERSDPAERRKDEPHRRAEPRPATVGWVASAFAPSQGRQSVVNA